MRPNDARVILGIASVQRRQGKMQLAAENMEKVVELDPRSSEASYNAAQTFTLIRNYSEAEKFINKSLVLTPDAPTRYDYKANLYLIRSGDIAKANAVLDEMASVSGDREEVRDTRVRLKIFEGKYDEALTQIQQSGEVALNSQFGFVPKAQIKAQIYGFKKQPVSERAYYDSSRIIMEKKIKEQPDDSRYHSALGIAYAGLGLKEQAVNEGKHGVELMPLSKEAWRGTYRLWDIASIYVMIGENDSAIDTYEQLLSIPSEVSAAYLRVDPSCAPLRNLPRFQKLLADKK